MKQRELKKCAGCGKGVMHANCPIFFRVRIERMAVNLPAVERQHGLELQLGRNAAIAAVLGPDEDIAVQLGDPVSILVCQDCSIKYTVAVLEETE